VNTLMAIIPEFDGEESSGDGPHGSVDINDRYVLLHVRDRDPKLLRECEVEVLQRFLPNVDSMSMC
jgi:hypothetical protein